MALVIGTGFTQLQSIDSELADALKAAAEVTVALDHYHHRRPNFPALVDIVDAANETQHKLLSLQQSIPLEPRRTDCLRSMCLSAALIYSDMILFPLPAVCEVKPRLARNLRHAMEKFDMLKADEGTSDNQEESAEDYALLTLWILMLGRLATEFTADSLYFIQKLRQYFSRVSYIGTWQDFSNVMATYLWWDYIFDEPSEKLWLEVYMTLPSTTRQGALLTTRDEDSPYSRIWITSPLPSQGIPPAVE